VAGGCGCQAALKLRREMKRCAAWMALALFAVGMPLPASAQPVPTEGDRVRITHIDGTVVSGIFMTASDRWVRLRPVVGQEAPEVAIDDIARIERSLGRQTQFWKHFGITMASSVIAMVGLVAVSWEPCTNFCSDFDDSRTSSALFYGSVVGSFVGLPLGVLLGSTITREPWETLSLTSPIALRLREGYRLGISVSISLGGR
jgi:hypothetical protein